MSPFAGSLTQMGSMVGRTAFRRSGAVHGSPVGELMNLPSSPSSAIELCHCGHADDEHDEVATRYCRATLSAALPRPCACAVGPDTSPRSYDWR